MAEYFFKQTKGDSQEDIEVQNIIYKGIQIKIPVCMKEMSEKCKRQHYPYEEKPNLILSNDKMDVEMTFQDIEGVTQTAGLAEIIYTVRKYVEENSDIHKIYPVRFLKSKNMYIGWFLTELFLGEKIVCHRKYIMLTGREMLIITITYPVEKNIKWGSIANKILFSIEVEDEKSRKNGC